MNFRADPSRFLFTRFLFFSLALCGVLFFASVAAASNVNIDLRYDRNETLSDVQRKALEKGFAAAVTENALAMLPAQPDETMQAVLSSFMEGRAGKFVLTYSDVQTASTDSVYSLSMNVSVNRAALHRYLQEIGLFSFLSGTTSPLTLSVTGAREEEAADITALRQLGGFTLQAAGLPSIDIRRADKETWQGVMRTESGEWTAQALSPDAVWTSLTARWFDAGQNEAASSTGGDRLVVEGWYTPDGVKEFDNLLRSWDDALADVSMGAMDLTSAGVSASWKLKVLNPGLFEERLAGYMSDRGLSYRMTE